MLSNLFPLIPEYITLAIRLHFIIIYNLYTFNLVSYSLKVSFCLKTIVFINTLNIYLNCTIISVKRYSYSNI